MQLTKEPQRFWSKVDIGEPNECWEWLASKRSPGGYGQFGIHYKIWRAHRVAWVLTYGPIPEGLCVLHRCDNKGCCNPYHLFLGTRADNMADAIRKGHAPLGEKHPSAKLTEDDVRTIRELYAAGVWTQEELADAFGVSRQAIGQVTRGESWKRT